MNIIQSYFNKNVSTENIDYAGGYLSSVINWLSMAYSCLLLKRNNPKDRLIFYGNQDMVHLFENVFCLPYDEYHIIECKGEYSDWFYCWPKILTYERQIDPFIHVDNDVFMWKSIPNQLREAPLVAQHQERDSKFYIDVYSQLLKDKVLIPDYLKSCYDGKYISSYNAGLLGGNDISFLRKYLSEIRIFIDSNKHRIAASDRKFLYNVVFEQWIFFGLTKQQDKIVRTFYKDPITDFDMVNANVPFQILSLGPLEYLHVMEHKDNIRCNRFIAYKMQSDFPNEYERILSKCRGMGIRNSIFTSYSGSQDHDCNLFPRINKLKEIADVTEHEIYELQCFEEDSLRNRERCFAKREIFMHYQKVHNEIIDSIRDNGISNLNCELILNPLLETIEAKESLVRSLLYNSKKAPSSNMLVLRLYNPIFNRMDEFIWSKSKFQLLTSILREYKIKDLFNSSDSLQLKQIDDFVKQCIVDGIITFKQ